MKQLLIFAFTLLSISAFGQSTDHSKGVTVNPTRDTTLKVIYAENNHHKSHKPVAYYVNDELVGETIFGSLKPDQILSIDVVKQNVVVGGTQYEGKIYIKTKGNYAPKPISLNALKAKYTNLKEKATIFMVDGALINTDYDKYLVDESYLLRIIVDKLENTKENIDLNLIKILTKTEANIKQVNQIMIRGTE
jgi:hypothetical protein